MRMLETMLIASVLGFAVAGCTSDEEERNAEITCDAFDSYFAACSPNCGRSFDCEDEYTDLGFDEQLTLDDCADCLAANADLCIDCTISGASCFALLTTELGADCVFF